MEPGAAAAAIPLLNTINSHQGISIFQDDGDHLVLEVHWDLSRFQKMLCSWLRSNPPLVRMTIQYSDMNGVNHSELSSALRGITTLQSLTLHENLLHEKHSYSLLSQVLRRNPQLRSLDLRNNRVSPPSLHDHVCCAQFFNAVALHPSIDSICFRCSEAIPMCVNRSIVSAVQVLPSLTHLNLSVNIFDADGFKALAAVLQQHPALLDLNLSHCKLDSGALTDLAEVVRCNTVLRCLKVVSDVIAPVAIQGYIRIASTMRHNTALRSLYLHWWYTQEAGSDLLRSHLLEAMRVRPCSRRFPLPSIGGIDLSSYPVELGLPLECPGGGQWTVDRIQSHLHLSHMERLYLFMMWQRRQEHRRSALPACVLHESIRRYILEMYFR